MAAKNGHKGKKVRGAEGVVEGPCKKLTVVKSCRRAQNHIKVIKGLKLSMAARVPEKEVISRLGVSKGQRVFTGGGGVAFFQKSVLHRDLAGPETHQATLLSLPP